MADPTYISPSRASNGAGSQHLFFRFSLHSQTYTVCPERERERERAPSISSTCGHISALPRPTSRPKSIAIVLVNICISKYFYYKNILHNSSNDTYYALKVSVHFCLYVSFLEQSELPPSVLHLAMEANHVLGTIAQINLTCVLHDLIKN